VLRQPVEPELPAAIAVMYEPVTVGAGMQRLLQRVQRQVCAERRCHAPAHDPASEDVDDERDVDEPIPRRDIGEIGYPKRVGTRRRERALDEICRASRAVVPYGRDGERSTAGHAPQAHGPHEPLDRAARGHDPFPAELAPHLLGPVDAEVLVPDALDRHP
jgi:hypothetical protein